MTAGGHSALSVQPIPWHILTSCTAFSAWFPSLPLPPSSNQFVLPGPCRMHEPVDNLSLKWDAWASLETLKEIVSALIFLHEHNILHGDLKVR